jgi:hypothetical protein
VEVGFESSIVSIKYNVCLHWPRTFLPWWQLFLLSPAGSKSWSGLAVILARLTWSLSWGQLMGHSRWAQSPRLAWPALELYMLLLMM